MDVYNKTFEFEFRNFDYKKESLFYMTLPTNLFADPNLFANI